MARIDSGPAPLLIDQTPADGELLIEAPAVSPPEDGVDGEVPSSSGVGGFLDRAVAAMTEAALAAAEKEAEKRASQNAQAAVAGPTDVQVDGYHFDDVKQGGLSDCYLLASVAALARQDPGAIDRMISNERYDAAGNLESCSVTLHVKNARGQLEPTEVEVDCRQFGVLSANVGDVDGAGRQELWPKIIEKAYAQIAPDSYYSIGNSGHPHEAMETLTGQPAAVRDIGAVSFEQLEADLQAGKLVTVSTHGTRDANNEIIKGKEKLDGEFASANVYGSHAYTVTDARVDDDGQRWVKIYNPWGTEHPGDQGWLKFEDAKALFRDASVGNR